MDIIFFETESAWHLLYTVIISKFMTSLSVRYARRLNPVKCAYFDRLQAAVILIKPTVKIRKATYFICFEQKNAWSRFALILFKLHEIWTVDCQEND